jgi:hypothetical protein
MEEKLSLKEALATGLTVAGSCNSGHRFQISIEKLQDLVGPYGGLDRALANYAFCPDCGAVASSFEMTKEQADRGSS